jgi:Ni2+-binding GTPase involved in maturation of urease and hydrogenase
MIKTRLGDMCRADKNVITTRSGDMCHADKNMITTRSGDMSNLQIYDQDKVR